MFNNGLVVGKFYPYTKGHKHLISVAESRCKKVTVIVCWRDGQDISGVERARWIQREHPNVHVILIDDNTLADDDSKAWAKHTLKLLGFKPDAVFTSEDYGDEYARQMGCIHVLVDKERLSVPISATMVRSDPMKYAGFLTPQVRAYFARRVAVIGAESTGKTTLVKDLARHYGTVWVPEYGRVYTDGKGFTGPEGAWRPEEFVAIANGQNELEDSLAEASNGLVICDTDAFATGIWYERYFGARSPAVEAIAKERKYDLYILTDDAIPFEQDGTRDGNEEIRSMMHNTFIKRLHEAGKKYLLVRGSKEERLAQAIRAIDGLAVMSSGLSILFATNTGAAA